MKIRKLLKANLTIYYSYLLLMKVWFKLFYNDRDFFLMKYKKTYKVYPDLENPKTFHEKMIWSMLNHRNELYIKYADKYEVREYVKLKIGEEYLIKNYAIFNKIEEINFNELPFSFVLKATHASGWNLICSNKKEFNKHKTLRLLKFWFSQNYYEFDREWHYNYMPKRVICDEYIGNEDGTVPLDYKIFCFNGEPKFIQLDIDRFIDHKRNFYDIEWNLLKENKTSYEQDFSKVYEKPRNYEKMLEIARILSKGFEHVRIDLYNIEGKILFGEMTFFSGGGVDYFSGNEYQLLVGSWFELPKANINMFNICYLKDERVIQVG